MIEQLFEDLKRLSEGERHQQISNKLSPADPERNQAFLSALTVVQRIVRRKLLSSWQTDGSDLAQSIALRLWTWRTKYKEKSERMSSDDWQAFAARTTYNEINRHFGQGVIRAEESLDSASNLQSEQAIAGESDAEFESLVRFVWQAVCQMTVRQRRALLLHSQELIVYLLRGGVSETELLTVLEISTLQWSEIRIQLPLSDIKIALIGLEDNHNITLESSAKSIKKARHEARLKLKQNTKK